MPDERRNVKQMPVTIVLALKFRQVGLIIVK